MTTPVTPLNDAAQQAALLDKLPVGITVIDLQGRILYYNGYVADPARRGPGFLLTISANVLLLVGGVVGALLSLR